MSYPVVNLDVNGRNGDTGYSAPMGARNGVQFRAGLKRHRREVWIRGRRVDDVTTDPVFAKPIEHIARLYEMQHDPASRDVLTYLCPDTCLRAGTSFMPSRTVDDLRKRHEAYRLWAEATCGMLGRSPDFVNSAVLAYAEGAEIFARLGERYRDNALRYYRYVRDHDLFLTHAIVTMPVDRSKPAAQQADPFVNMGVVRETSEGLIIRGARMLATHGPIADEVLIYNNPRVLVPGDEPYALVCALPMDAPGLRIICREPFDEGGRSSFDHPLATNFEEPDALLVFDDVVVPWDRVFLHGNVGLANAAFLETPLRQHTGHQTAVRAVVKLQLAVGAAIAVAESTKSNTFLHVQQMLGECLEYIDQVKACIVRSEVEFETLPGGTICPAYWPNQTVRGIMARCYPRVIEILQTVGAGGLLMMPCAADFGSAIGADIAKYYRGAEEMAAEARVRLFKLAWDLAGDAFGMRQVQYERYYAGDPVRNLAGYYATYPGKDDCQRMVARALALGADLREAAK